MPTAKTRFVREGAHGLEQGVAGLVLAALRLDALVLVEGVELLKEFRGVHRVSSEDTGVLPAGGAPSRGDPDFGRDYEASWQRAAQTHRRSRPAAGRVADRHGTGDVAIGLPSAVRSDRPEASMAFDPP